MFSRVSSFSSRDAEGPGDCDVDVDVDGGGGKGPADTKKIDVQIF
jgi:hypothetical protein